MARLAVAKPTPPRGSVAGHPGDIGVLRQTRAGDLSATLTVTDELKGEATEGVFGQTPTPKLTFAAGPWVRLRPRDDAGFEGDQAVVLRLVDGPACDLGIRAGLPRLDVARRVTRHPPRPRVS